MPRSAPSSYIADAVGFFPGTELVLSAKDSRYRELPTIPSAFDRLLGQVESLPLDHFVEQTLEMLNGLDRLVNSKQMPHLLASLDRAASELAQASAEVRARIGPTGDRLDTSLNDLQAATRRLSVRFDETLATLEQAAEAIQRLVQDAGAEIEPVARSLRSAGDSAQTAFDTAGEAVDQLASAFAEHSPLNREALSSLREVAAAARALRGLADFLERHPEALLRGKQ